MNFLDGIQEETLLTLLYNMYKMSISEDWSETDAQSLIIHGGALYKEIYKLK